MAFVLHPATEKFSPWNQSYIPLNLTIQCCVSNDSGRGGKVAAAPFAFSDESGGYKKCPAQANKILSTFSYIKK